MRRKVLKKVLSRTIKTTYWTAMASAVIIHFIYYGVLPGVASKEKASNSHGL
jgi:hypothetical protein